MKNKRLILTYISKKTLRTIQILLVLLFSCSPLLMATSLEESKNEIQSYIGFNWNPPINYSEEKGIIFTTTKLKNTSGKAIVVFFYADIGFGWQKDKVRKLDAHETYTDTYLNLGFSYIRKFRVDGYRRSLYALIDDGVLVKTWYDDE